jgi:hypothetical protein
MLKPLLSTAIAALFSTPTMAPADSDEATSSTAKLDLRNQLRSRCLVSCLPSKI